MVFCAGPLSILVLGISLMTFFRIPWFFVLQGCFFAGGRLFLLILWFSIFFVMLMELFAKFFSKILFFILLKQYILYTIYCLNY